MTTCFNVFFATIALIPIRVIVPNIRGTIVAGFVLRTARSLGEVSITLMLGDKIVGRTNTMLLEIYNAVFNSEYPHAIILSACLVSLQSSRLSCFDAIGEARSSS